MTRFPVFPICALLGFIARPTGAQNPDSSHRDSGAVVSGVVRDSISLKPLRDAAVQLVASDTLVSFSRVTVSDSLGRFSIANVPDGHYVLGFFHPILDSLGLEAPLRGVEVVAQRPVRVDLAVPSPEQLRIGVCGRKAADAGSVMVGVVRDARDDTPVVGATVLAEWMEITYSARHVTPKIPGVAVTSGENGWFAVCGLPKAGIITLTASHGADSTGSLEVDIPPDRFLRRDLYLGAARATETADTGSRADSSSTRMRRYHTGEGRLSGTVVAVASGKPIAGAQIGIAGGPNTHANDRGEWTLADAPAGTRMLEVRAVGYYPHRQPVDVVANASPMRVSLFTLRAMLDTVKVTAARLARRLPTGFDDRRRSGAGTYITPADVAKHNLIVASDLFRFASGVRIETVGPFRERAFSMPGAFTDRCQPEVYLNNHYMDHIGPDEFDSWVRPNEILGIEIYSEASVPPQFHRSMGDCGAIVIWSKGW